MYVMVTIDNRHYHLHRDRLQTAILVLLYNPDDGRAALNALRTQYGFEHNEALRMTLAAAHCLREGIEP